MARFEIEDYQSRHRTSTTSAAWNTRCGGAPPRRSSPSPHSAIVLKALCTGAAPICKPYLLTHAIIKTTTMTTNTLAYCTDDDGCVGDALGAGLSARVCRRGRRPRRRRRRDSKANNN
ncbi:unnamed protein product [Heligmosomoides polygyrus]|uniref:Uncharacterized protein n=1 Tax=Heligmosomoides polygyrus TaxID=6339 RepID=A0A183GB15_HELPZ|nr:unnamed protein product [Heligmosomoides polygyrus]